MCFNFIYCASRDRYRCTKCLKDKGKLRTPKLSKNILSNYLSTRFICRIFKLIINSWGKSFQYTCRFTSFWLRQHNYILDVISELAPDPTIIKSFLHYGTLWCSFHQWTYYQVSSINGAHDEVSSTNGHTIMFPPPMEHTMISPPPIGHTVMLSLSMSTLWCFVYQQRTLWYSLHQLGTLLCSLHLWRTPWYSLH